MQQRTHSPFFAAMLAVGAFGLGACSLALDTQKAQCSKPSDCDNLLRGSSTQLCVKGFCDPVECADDAECRDHKERDTFASSYCDSKTLICQPGECTTSDDCGPGANDQPQYCLESSSRCVAADKATCASDVECDRYEGLDTYICDEADKVCVPPQCKTSKDCAGMSTPICTAGRCNDPVFGCAMEPDPRPKQTTGKATFSIPVVNVLGNAPITKDPSDPNDKGLVVKVCGSEQIDAGCALGIPGTKTSYNEETGQLKVTGLPPGQQFRLTFEAKGFLPVDFYTQVTPLEDTVELQPALLVPPGIVDSLDTAFMGKISVDLTQATIIARIHDCAEPPGNASGATIAIDEAVTSTEVFYLEGITVLPDDPYTTGSGSGGIANVTVKPHVVTISRDGDTITTFAVTPRGNRLTYINFYPRKYVPQNL